MAKSKVQPIDVKDIEDLKKSYQNFVHHNSELTERLKYVYKDERERYRDENIFNAIDDIYQFLTKIDIKPPAPTFRSLKLKVVSASKDDGNKPDNTLDGDPGTRYSSKEPDANIVYEIDEDTSKTKIVKAGVSFYKGNERTNTFEIHGSADNKNWILLESAQSSGTTQGLEEYDFNTIGQPGTKFIKVTGKGNSANNGWTSITAFEVFGDSGETTIPPTPPEPPVEPPTEPTEPTKPGKTIALKYKAKDGGQNVTKFTGPQYSEHDDKDRNSLYSEPKEAFSATNGQVGGYVRMKMKKKDQLLYKVLSGNHGDPSMAGRCYGCGFEINGDSTALHAVKELNHPTTPRITDKIEVLHKGKLPSINDKTVGYRINHWVNKDGHTVVEFDADFSVLDTPPEQLKEAPNKFEPMFRFVDKGNWGLSKDKKEDANITENSGITYKGRKMGYYFRADEVPKGAASVALEQAVEIQAPN